MNTINRVVIVVLLLILIPLVSVLLVIPHSILTSTGAWMTDLGETLWRVSPWIRLSAGILLALIFDALALLLIYLEVRRKRTTFIRVQQISGGMATLSVESIVQQLQYQLDPMENVIGVKPAVQAKGNKVKATVDVTVAPGGNVPEMASRLVEAVEEVLTTDLGLQISGAPQIRMKVAAPPPRSEQPKSQPSRPRPRVIQEATLDAPLAAPPDAPTALEWQSPDSQEDDAEETA